MFHVATNSVAPSPLYYRGRGWSSSQNWKVESDFAFAINNFPLLDFEVATYELRYTTCDLLFTTCDGWDIRLATCCLPLTSWDLRLPTCEFAPATFKILLSTYHSGFSYYRLHLLEGFINEGSDTSKQCAPAILSTEDRKRQQNDREGRGGLSLSRTPKVVNEW